MDWTFSFCSLHNIIAYYCIFDLASVWQCSRKVTLSCCNNVVWPWIVGERRDQKWVIENTPSILKVDISDDLTGKHERDKIHSAHKNEMLCGTMLAWANICNNKEDKEELRRRWGKRIMFISSDCLYKSWKSSCLQLYKKIEEASSIIDWWIGIELWDQGRLS